MLLTTNFTLAELSISDHALRHGIDNTPPPAVLDELRRTAQLLQRIRDELSASTGIDTPLLRISGYRCLLLNRSIGSADGSDHVTGMAADFQVLRLTPYQICQALLPKLDQLGLGQLIHEPGWVHVSTRLPARPVNRVITIDRLGTRAGILPRRA